MGKTADEAEDPVTKRQVAWIGAAATVLAAILAIIAGGVSGMVTGNSASDRSRDEFLRTKRQAAFARYIADEADLTAAERAFVTLCIEDRKKTIVGEEFQKAYKPYEAAWRKLQLSRANVEILATAETAGVAYDVMLAHRTMNDFFVFEADDFECSAIDKAVPNLGQPPVVELVRFTNAAREDLDASK